ncbi:N-acetyl-1-D-myo-Inosityl-2-amino-2-deoxy-alpha-D-glucopyranoside deacetylase MshB [Gordonia effusa NBRC 100432]|uniref:N-acetyl-1-D-myo-Inosityl-2-amino-2-deoxy-alpha-D-glucopyranoside deacetylase MshB n=1 Tax=Gordonia effusa NBRC 100432 TaxID=1077974 RepID=H0QX19_9ACTN|nr:PIG-L family deacetylase [Gordonia effusa]GAB17370.1 N-acetyl-1-D-myo-Inosityl-2-amino-2-deoxy-alpha-D-glucopyranoside deacetylase MshB [Gordonia effusa NBRC 100432]
MTFDGQPPRIVGVHAHPDDESIWTGGILARHVARGGIADTITCTWAAGTHRHGELITALGRLGVERLPEMLGYADGGVPESAPDQPRFVDAPFDDAVGSVVELLRRLQPDIVVTYDAYGVYGHPDHIHAHRVALAAIEAAADSHLFPGRGSPWQVKSLYFVTIGQDQMAGGWGDLVAKTTDPSTLPGTPADRIDVVADVRDWLAVKWSAIQAHQSEFNRSRTLKSMAALEPAALEQLMGVESFQRRDLVPGGSDLL